MPAVFYNFFKNTGNFGTSKIKQSHFLVLCVYFVVPQEVLMFPHVSLVPTACSTVQSLHCNSVVFVCLIVDFGRESQVSFMSFMIYPGISGRTGEHVGWTKWLK